MWLHSLTCLWRPTVESLHASRCKKFDFVWMNGFEYMYFFRSALQHASPPHNTSPPQLNLSYLCVHPGPGRPINKSKQRRRKAQKSSCLDLTLDQCLCVLLCSLSGLSSFWHQRFCPDISLQSQCRWRLLLRFPYVPAGEGAHHQPLWFSYRGTRSCEHPHEYCCLLLGSICAAQADLYMRLREYISPDFAICYEGKKNLHKLIRWNNKLWICAFWTDCSCLRFRQVKILL